jgi:hypothetical protein
MDTPTKILADPVLRVGAGDETPRRTFRQAEAQRRALGKAGNTPPEADPGTHLREITGRPERRSVNRGRRHSD